MCQFFSTLWDVFNMRRLHADKGFMPYSKACEGVFQWGMGVMDI